MPTIPGAPARRQISQGQQSIVRAPGSPGTDAMRDVAKDFRKTLEVRGRDEVAKAKNKYYMLKAEQDNAYNDDEEYGTIPQRYSKTMTEGLGIAASGISDPQLRDQFMMEFEVDLERGKQRINEVAGNKAKDFERSEINGELKILQNAAISDAGDPVSIHGSVRERLQAAAERNIISFEEAQSIGDSFRVDVATNKLKAMGAKDRLDALTAPWADDIPDHITKVLRDEANAELRLGEAQGAAQSALDAGLTEREAEKKFRSLRDQEDGAQLYRDTMHEFKYLYENKRSTEVEERGTAYTEIWEALNPAEGKGVPLSNIRTKHTELWEKLTKGERDNLYQLEQHKLSGARQYSDRRAWLDMQRLASRAGESKYGRAQFEEYYMENSAKLNNTDFQNFGKMLYEEREDLLNVSQLLDTYTRAMTNQKDINRVTTRTLDWYESEYERNDGFPPSTEDVRKKIEFESKELYGTGWFSDDRPGSVEDMDDFVDAYFEDENENLRELIRTSISEGDVNEFENLVLTDPRFKDFQPADKADFKLNILRRIDPNQFRDFQNELGMIGINYDLIRDPLVKEFYLKQYQAARKSADAAK